MHGPYHESILRQALRLLVSIGAAIALGSGLPTAVTAQRTDHAVSGTVRDEAGQAIENALVALDPKTDARTTRTDSTGRFRFDRVSRGNHDLAVVWIGYRTDVRTLAVPDSGVDLVIILRKNTAILDTLHVLARRTGVYGTVIARQEFLPLPKADVEIVGMAKAKMTTGPNGQFDFPMIPHGAWVAHVRSDGYESRMLSVVVPRDSAIELAITMDRSSVNIDKHMGELLREFDSRTRWMTGSRGTLVPRQELLGHPGVTLAEALRYSLSYMLKGFRLDDATCIYVNGVFQPTMMAKDYQVQDIEAVEVYATGGDYTGEVTARNGTPAKRRPPGGQCGWADQASALSTSRTVGQPVVRGDPTRVETLVIWTRR